MTGGLEQEKKEAELFDPSLFLLGVSWSTVSIFLLSAQAVSLGVIELFPVGKVLTFTTELVGLSTLETQYSQFNLTTK